LLLICANAPKSDVYPTRSIRKVTSIFTSGLRPLVLKAFHDVDYTSTVSSIGAQSAKQNFQYVTHPPAKLQSRPYLSPRKFSLCEHLLSVSLCIRSHAQFTTQFDAVSVHCCIQDIVARFVKCRCLVHIHCYISH